VHMRNIFASNILVSHKSKSLLSQEHREETLHTTIKGLTNTLDHHKVGITLRPQYG